MVVIVWVRTRPVVVHVANSSHANVMVCVCVFVSVFHSVSPRGVRGSTCIRRNDDREPGIFVWLLLLCLFVSRLDIDTCVPPMWKMPECEHTITFYTYACYSFIDCMYACTWKCVVFVFVFVCIFSVYIQHTTSHMYIHEYLLKWLRASCSYTQHVI